MSQRAKIKNLEFVGLFARTTLFLESFMPLGKYRGEVVETVIETDPDYMDWFTMAVEQYTLDRVAQHALDTTPRNGSGEGEEDYELDFLESPGTLLSRAFGHRR